LYLQGIYFFLLQLKIKSSQTNYLHYNISILSPNDTIIVKDSYNIIWLPLLLLLNQMKLKFNGFKELLKNNQKQSKKCYILLKDKTTISINSVICSEINFEMNIIFQTYICSLFGIWIQMVQIEYTI
jgi:hypothetical protein